MSRVKTKVNVELNVACQGMSCHVIHMRLHFLRNKHIYFPPKSTSS